MTSGSLVNRNFLFMQWVLLYAAVEGIDSPALAKQKWQETPPALKCVKKGRPDPNIIIQVLSTAEAKKHAEQDFISSSKPHPDSDDEEPDNTTRKRK